VHTHPLRQVLADVERGHRGSEEYRANFARLLADDDARARAAVPCCGTGTREVSQSSSGTG
jgi:hypothetical protein